MTTNINKTITSIILVGALMAPFSAGAATVEELQAQLNYLNSQLQQLQGSSGVPAACVGVNFLRNLRVGSNGTDVKCLQQLLNQDSATQVSATGMGSKGNETVLFGSLTKLAVIKFQEKYASEILTPSGLLRGTGQVGPATRAKLNAMLASAVAVNSSPVIPAVIQQPFDPAQGKKSQSELTVDAISKATPAVVSIIISREVAEYEVVYEDIFNNGSLSVQSPVYKPTGRIITQKLGAGSGFLITSEGHILTNRHVVADEGVIYTVTLPTGIQQVARVIYKDSTIDVAIIKIDPSTSSGQAASFPVLALGDSGALMLGQPIIAIGNAMGEFMNSVSLGIISGLNRTVNATDNTGAVQTLTDVIQTDAPIHPGNSGGPLLDLQANVVGINVAMVKGVNNISFAIPINAVKGIIKSVLRI
ncbi:MAG: trypsin-like peptidase domain-containing protein [bacterium]|nr:trypsin-like peptidase domain-containing protein [bacterium]